MASIIKRKKAYSVVYSYTDERGETKQKLKISNLTELFCLQIKPLCRAFWKILFAPTV